MKSPVTGENVTLEKILKGDREQFESLFRSTYVSLVRYARSMIKDHDSAEEIVQDLFVRIWQDRDKIKIHSSLNGYLFRSVHNRCLHLEDHKKVIGRHIAEMADRPEYGNENVTDLINYRDLQDRVAEILNRLPERCGRIFCMNRFEGLKYSEIAEKLSISVKTVEANMGRALQEFRKALTE